MAPDSDIQVLVVGAGTGGLSLAGFLEWAGFDPVLIERAETPARPHGVVELWPDAVALLDRLGVGEAVRDAGQCVTTWKRRQADGTVTARLDADTAFGFVAVEYARLRAQLRDAVSDEALHAEATLRTLDSRRSGVTVEFTNGVREPFDLVVGADGVHSHTRGLLGGGEPTFCGTTSVALPLDAGAVLQGANEVWTADGAVFRAVPVGEADAAGWLTVPTTVPGQDWSDAAALADCCPEIDWLLPEVLESVGVEDLWWADDFRMPTTCWADDRVALLGDAAHARHPLTGVDATLAIEDAAVLASELIERADPPAARLADYAARRQSRLDQLGDHSGRSPLAGIDSELADRQPSVPEIRGARLASCFGSDSPTPVDVRPEDD
ncbi:MAG: FAD-dependent oxidoreductase [Haloglomus sp.]